VQVFPYKWIVAQFGAFIVLCGLTHLVSLWTLGSTSALAFATMTFFKVTTAFVSCATAITLSWVIPEVLSVKKREILLAIKVSFDDDCKSSSFFSPESVHCTKTGASFMPMILFSKEL
jgi:hypothetical protein